MKKLILSLLFLVGCASSPPSTLEQAGMNAGAGAVAASGQPAAAATQKPKGGGGPGAEDK